MEGLRGEEGAEGPHLAQPRVRGVQQSCDLTDGGGG